MNRVYKVIFSKVKRAYVVVSEKAKVNANSSKTKRMKAVLTWSLAAFMAAGFLVGPLQISQANTNDEVYVHVNTGEKSQKAGELATNKGKVSDKGGARGELSVAIGVNAKAFNAENIAIGNNAIAGDERYSESVDTRKSSRAIAIGNNAQATKEDTIALGSFAQANEDFSIAAGNHAMAYGRFSLGLGYYAKADRDNSIALGNHTTARENSVAISNTAQALDEKSVAIGYEAKADYYAAKALAIGSESLAKGEESVALGYKSIANARNSLAAIGANVAQEAIGGIGIGKNTKVQGKRSIAIGSGYVDAITSQSLATEATADYSVAIGYNSKAKGKASSAFGPDSKAIGYYSNALGNMAHSEGHYSTALGTNALVGKGADGATAIGWNSVASSGYSVAIGGGANNLDDKGAKASGLWSVALGHNTLAKGSQSTALANGAQAIADNSLAIGTATNASGVNATAIGIGASATVKDSLALGSYSVANHESSIALGALSKTKGFTKITKIKLPGNNNLELKDYEFAGAKNILGVMSVGSDNNTRQIVNLAPGRVSKDSTDAINGSQLFATNMALGNLKEEIKKNKEILKHKENVFIHVNTGIASQEKGNSDTNYGSITAKGGALGYKSVAIGENAQSKGEYSITLGQDAKTQQNASLALGNGANADGVFTAAIGYSANASGENSMAVGKLAKATGIQSLAFGVVAKAQQKNSMAIGQQADSSMARGIAIGVAAVTEDENYTKIKNLNSEIKHLKKVNESLVNTDPKYLANIATINEKNAKINELQRNDKPVGGISIGNSSFVNSTGAVALGNGAQAKNDWAVTIGGSSVVEGSSAVAIGAFAEGKSMNATAIGREAHAYGVQSVALGASSTAKGWDGIAMGASAVSKGGHTIALGTYAKAGNQLITEGEIQAELANIPDDTAEGKKQREQKEAELTGGYAMAFGNNAEAIALDSIAIGHGASANHIGALALGYNSVTKDAVAVNQYVDNGLKYQFAGNSPVAVISIGAQKKERQIVNLAAGQINANSTDAVNGSQLYATNKVIGNIASTLKTNVLGGNAQYDENGNFTMTDVGGTGIDNINDAIGKNRTDIVKINGDVSKIKDDVTTIQGDITTIKGDVNNIKGDITTIKGDITDVKNDVNNIKGDITTIQGDITDIKTDVTNVKGDITTIQGDITDVKTDITNIKGDINNKANADLGNITDEGKKVIQQEAQAAVKVEAAKNADGTSNTVVNKVVDSATGSITYQVGLADKVSLGTGENQVNIDGEKGQIKLGKTTIGKDAVAVGTTNIADGHISGIKTEEIKELTDAVNKEYVDKSIGAIDNAVGSAIGEMRDDMAAIGAHNAALSALKVLQYRPEEKTQIMAGVGRYKNKNAYALGLAVHSNEDLLWNGGISFGKGNTLMMNAGVTWRVGTKGAQEAPEVLKDGPITAIKGMNERIDKLTIENRILKNQNSLQNAALEEQERKNAQLEKEIKEIKEQLAVILAGKA